ncbi:sulfotransferase family protein [Nitrosococcus oceani]|uniref:sulfotransferase family protein n=1 Tax=Nitrosococcus oceani TaxID=1229 RepID=UPI0004E8D0B7|nr:sulfotransferase [Nitrosococcus oceani]KFI22372.1 hypothetical protein HW44_09915 [Nitrosococcus oceani]
MNPRFAGTVHKPDFFIVGAPKSGTTSMMRYLDEHPNIAMPQRREPNFFGKDFNWPQFKIGTWEDYLAIFHDAPDLVRIGEKSVWYLYSATAAQEIKNFNPESRIIIMLRSPIDMMVSLHQQLLKTDDENIVSFESALQAETLRKKGLQMPPRTRLREGLFYREVARYSEQVERYIQVFGKDKVHIIIYDEFKRNPANEYYRVLDFIGVEKNFLPKFRIYNARSRFRSYFLKRLIMKEPLYYRLIPGAIRSALEWRIERWNRIPGQHVPISQNLRKCLKEELQQDVERLSSIIGRDLSDWY